MTDLLVDALAVFRIWRLAALDDILEDPRSRAIAWAWSRAKEPEPGHPAPLPTFVTFLACPWCLGFWLVLAAVTCRRYLPRVWWAVRTVAATSALVGLIAEGEARLH